MHGLLIVLVSLGLLGDPGDPLETNLNIHFNHWLQTRSLKGDSDFIRICEKEEARDLVSVFFNEGLAQDSRRVAALTDLFLSRLITEAHGMPREAFQALEQAFLEGLSNLKKRSSYQKEGWREAAATGLLVPFSAHAMDKILGWLFKFKPLREAFRWPHRRVKNSTLVCKVFFVDLAKVGKKSAEIADRHPRLLLYGLLGPAAYFVSYSQFFGDLESWDALERAVENRILPVIRTRT